MFEFPLIGDPIILAIPIQECGEALVDIKTINGLAFGDVPETPLTTNDYTFMREAVYQKLINVQKELPTGYRLRLYEAYRNLVVQQDLFEIEKKRVLEVEPELSGQALFNRIIEVVSPVINYDGSKNIPPHNTGAAVDVEIIDQHGVCIDMGMEAKDWQQVPHELCLTDSSLITEQQRFNRQLLLSLMTAQGFVNYPTEWWHFSYGDRYWAYHQKQSHAIYGSTCELKKHKDDKRI